MPILVTGVKCVEMLDYR